MSTDMQHITPDDIRAQPAGTSVLDLLEIPAGSAVQVVILGSGTPYHQNDAMFVHFRTLTVTDLKDWSVWGERSDAQFEFDGDFYNDEFVEEIRSHWPDAVILDYGCFCCWQDYGPRPYERQTVNAAEALVAMQELAAMVDRHRR